MINNEKSRFQKVHAWGLLENGGNYLNLRPNEAAKQREEALRSASTRWVSPMHLSQQPFDQYVLQVWSGRVCFQPVRQNVTEKCGFMDSNDYWVFSKLEVL